MLKGIFKTKLTETSTEDKEGVGTIRMDDKGNTYQWVKNAESSTALTLGAYAHNKLSDGANLSNYVYAAATANLGVPAGIVCATDGIAAGSYGWIQRRGYNSDALVFASQTTAKTAGDVLIGVNAQLYADAGVTMGTAPLYTRGLVLLEAVATITTGAGVAHKVYVSCF